MVKIVLSEIPSRGECPFSNEWNDKECNFRNIRAADHDYTEECRCIGGYYDCITFDFDKCPYCTSFRNLQEVKNENKSEEE